MPQIISSINEKVISCGGEIHFNSKFTDFDVQRGKITEITINEDKKIRVENLILATGHSARDIYELLHSKNIQLSSKPFALGVRIEHTQDFIDQAQYGRPNDEFLPPASYKLSTQIDDKGVYSFCMCQEGSSRHVQQQKKKLSPMDGRPANVTIPIQIRVLWCQSLLKT